MKLYLRKSVPRVFEGAPRTCLDLGVIEVEEGYWRQGYARRAIALLASLNPFESLFIENVNNLILTEALVRWGYQKSPHHLNSFYRLGHPHP